MSICTLVTSTPLSELKGLKSLGAYDRNAIKMSHSIYWSHAIAWIQPAQLEPRIGPSERKRGETSETLTTVKQ